VPPEIIVGDAGTAVRFDSETQQVYVYYDSSIDIAGYNEIGSIYEIELSIILFGN
jgi:hypothetical protein